MFYNASSFTSDLSKWQTGNVTDMGSMLEGATALEVIPAWYSSRHR